MSNSAEAHLSNRGLAALRLGLLSLLVVLGTTLFSACGGDEPELPAITPVVSTAVPTQTAPTAMPQATPTSAPALAVSTPVPPAEGAYGLETVGTGFKRPLYLTYAPGDAGGRLFIVEQNGTVAILRDGRRQEALFLDIDSRVGSSANEQGLLSIAFDPEYAANGIFLRSTTRTTGEIRWSPAIASLLAIPTLPIPIARRCCCGPTNRMEITTAAQIKFGPDGYLYIGLGDGGSGGDPLDSGQDRGTLLGTLLRIDVRTGGGYAVPADNPFVGHEGPLPEIWAWGLRNAWRFSFDRVTGDLFIADVGQNKLEEVNFQPASSPGGENYGWNRFEGSQPYGNRSTEGMARREMVFPDRGIWPRRGLLRDRWLRVSRPATAGARRQLHLWRLLFRHHLDTDTSSRRYLAAHRASCRAI